MLAESLESPEKFNSFANDFLDSKLLSRSNALSKSTIDVCQLSFSFFLAAYPLTTEFTSMDCEAGVAEGGFPAGAAGVAAGVAACD